MYVPPFVPQQIEIPGNVATESYLVRLGFIRRVVGAHAVSVAIILVLSFLPRTLSLTQSAGLTLIALLGLSLVRGLVKGKNYEQILSALLAPVLFLGIAQMVAIGPERGWPQWTIGIAPLAIVLYTLACGRDLSFMGMFVICAIFDGLALMAMRLAGVVSGDVLWEAILIGVVYIFYFVYDLAALLTRRRLGEEIGAVLDLYRDVLNFTTYTVRVIRHWRKHRIWSLK